MKRNLGMAVFCLFALLLAASAQRGGFGGRGMAGGMARGGPAFGRGMGFGRGVGMPGRVGTGISRPVVAGGVGFLPRGTFAPHHRGGLTVRFGFGNFGHGHFFPHRGFPHGGFNKGFFNRGLCFRNPAFCGGFFGSGFSPFWGYGGVGYGYWPLWGPDYASYDSSANNDMQRVLAQQQQLIQDLEQEVRQRRESELERRVEAPAPPPPPAPAAPSRATGTEHPSAPTTLVFRDQHRIQTDNYAIADRKLYVLDTRGKRTIPLSELDIPATVRANEERGVEFKVPNAS